MLLKQLSLQPFSQYGGAYCTRDSAESPNPYTFPLWDGCSLPGWLPPNDMVNSESVVGIKYCVSSVVIGYKVDEFIHT